MLAVAIFPRLGPSIHEATGGCRWLNLFIAAGLLGAITEAVTVADRFLVRLCARTPISAQQSNAPRLAVATREGLPGRRRAGHVAAGGPLCHSVGDRAVVVALGDPWLAGVTVVLGQLLPVLILPLFYKVTRLEDPGLLERLRRLTEGTDAALRGHLPFAPQRGNQEGQCRPCRPGRTRRVLLGDTLLEQFTPEEIEVVFAHEVGHHVHHHLPKMIGINVFLALAGFWLVDRLLTTLAPVLVIPAWRTPSRCRSCCWCSRCSAWSLPPHRTP